MGPLAIVRDDVSVKESVLDLIVNIDPVENYLLSNLQRSSANDEFHFTLQDTLKAPALIARIEGADPSYANTNPVREMNVLHIIDDAFNITDSEQATDRYGSPEDRVAYETEKALKNWANKAEFALLRSTLISGTGSNARQMAGLKSSLSVTTSQSGVSLSETILNDRLQAVWDQGGNVDVVLAPMTLKRRISGFNGDGGSKFYNQEDRRLVLPIEVYESDASGKPVKLVAHRFVTVSGDLNFDLIGIEADKFAVAYLREPKVRPLAKTGDSERRQVIGELTLEVRNPEAGFISRAHL